MNIASDYRNLPIRHKLRVMIMATVTVAVVISVVAGAVYGQQRFRDAIV